jgi:hypothetical protein
MRKWTSVLLILFLPGMEGIASGEKPETGIWIDGIHRSMQGQLEEVKWFVLWREPNVEFEATRTDSNTSWKVRIGENGDIYSIEYQKSVEGRLKTFKVPKKYVGLELKYGFAPLKDMMDILKNDRLNMKSAQRHDWKLEVVGVEK